jgi:polar amino acid transport system substrate-binding protein
MKNIFISILLLLASVSVLAIEADGNKGMKPESITIATPVWKGWTNEDGTGLYFELLKLVYQPVGVSVQYEFVPWARAEGYIDLKKNDAMLGSYNTVDAYFPNYPIDTEYTAVVYKKVLAREWFGEETLRNKTIVWVRGYNYHKYLNVEVSYIDANNSEQGWLMLMADRVEYFMNSLTAINKFLKQNDIDRDDFNIETVLTKNLYLRFAKTKKSKQLIQIFDQRMKELVRLGVLKDLYAKWDSPYPNFESHEQ